MMAYDEGLVERIRQILDGQPNVVEKKMFGGLSFIVQGNMACGVTTESFLVRVGPDRFAEALFEAHPREMDFTGRPMKGWVYVADEGITADADLERWVKLGLDFALSLPAK
jgi:TfoX/Sxy family transcriptional regulator of competence genes